MMESMGKHPFQTSQEKKVEMASCLILSYTSPVGTERKNSCHAHDLCNASLFPAPEESTNSLPPAIASGTFLPFVDGAAYMMLSDPSPPPVSLTSRLVHSPPAISSFISLIHLTSLFSYAQSKA